MAEKRPKAMPVAMDAMGEVEVCAAEADTTPYVFPPTPIMPPQAPTADRVRFVNLEWADKARRTLRFSDYEG
jgi:hypothetical protein